jgi:nitrate reductase NapE component
VNFARHERFEALAAAHALGEATPAEREEFAAHARLCPRCAEDAEGGAGIVALLGAALSEERWQPQVDGALQARLAAQHTRRSERTFTALGFGVVASIVLNVAFVGGFAGRALDALRVTPPAERYADATRIVLERRAPRPARIAAAPRRSAARAQTLALRPLAPKARPAPHAAHPPAPAAQAPAADVFAGIALRPASRAAGLVALALNCAELRPGDEPAPEGCPVTPEFSAP